MQHPYQSNTVSALMPPDHSYTAWQLKNWTEDELFNLPIEKLMKVIIDISPEVNKAYTDFLRACNERWYYDVQPMHAKPVIDEFIARIETHHHDFDVLIDQIYAGIYLRGALFMELVLNDDADIARVLTK